MGKKYDYYVSRRNTPHLDLYTRLIGMFYGFLGFNFLLVFLYATILKKTEHNILYEYNILYLFLGILMFSLISQKTTDPKRGNRGLFSVVSDGCIWTILTFVMIYFLHFFVFIYLIEALAVTAVIMHYFKGRRRN